MAAAAAQQQPIELANTAKRDFLIALEQRAQRRWQDDKVFEANSPYVEGSQALPELGADFATNASAVRDEQPKWMGTFPYPYMNGSLHLGHAFTISKVEFAAGFERMRGKNVLWPVGFHATGMPIKAAADKLVREMEMFGADFERFDDGSNATEDAQAEHDEPGNAAADATSSATTSNTNAADPAKSKKGKLAGKATGLQYQFQIMESIKVPRSEIKKFAEPEHWLTYFPPLAMSDLDSFGARVDWRRSFITTPVNPYYDAFVRWQINKLHRLGYIKFGKRYTIFSPKDGQPCMDHDRQSGEGVGPQEYTALKMPLVDVGPNGAKLEQLAQGRKVNFVAATLRPETMYGQTNCFVGRTIKYGLFPARDGSLYLVTPRAARNMAYQGLLAEDDKVECVGEIEGKDLIGALLEAPNSVHGQVRLVPMDSVLATKGTGVVTCVPSDSPDDWCNTLELRKKAAYYGIDPEWVALEPISVLSTPTYGDLTAVALVDKLKIQSPKDIKQLAEAKELAYREGFYGGTMTYGPFKGEKVEEAKGKVREQLIKAGHAFAYSEPEGLVMSRSADECIVALCDQWYLDYGQSGWLEKAELLLSRMNTFSPDTRNGFEKTLGWLRQWACARSYGLGSRLPWDPQFLVESLSDSTIYMAYYTIAGLLHGPGPIDGSTVGPLGITADQMTDEVWDFIFSDGAVPQTTIAEDKLRTLKAEFSYFYPMDLRSSGKDLVPNHLTFCIYVHAALFSESNWPRAMRANGHLMLNGEKMSKSTGNSLTLRQAVEKFGADATRLALADSGDSLDDANFEELTANASILRLRTLLDWCEESLANQAQLRTGSKDLIWDRIFDAEMDVAISETYKHYANMDYKEALKTGLYTFLISRDNYRDATSAEGGMHVDLVRRFVRVQALLITPIAPHVAEHMWTQLLGESSSIQKARWPELSAPLDRVLLDASAFIHGTIKSVRDSRANFEKRKAKGKGAAMSFDPSKPSGVKLYVARQFPQWQEEVVQVVKDSTSAEGAIDDAKVRQALAKSGLIKDKKTMPFFQQFKRKVADLGAEMAYNRTSPFDETQVLGEAMPYMRKTLKMDTIDIVAVEQADASSAGYDKAIVEAAEPQKPGIVFYNL